MFLNHGRLYGIHGFEPDRVIKIHSEYHLIVTEETNTEPAYFVPVQ